MTQSCKNGKGPSHNNQCACNLDGLFQPRFFKALSDPNRVTILARLAQVCKPCTVTEVAEWCPIDISVVSRHLTNLKDAGILEAQKSGKEVFYSVRYPELTSILRGLADSIEACCPGTINKGRKT